ARARIQVVFQGGGAKLCALMAVCDVLKQYHAENRIEITRVAGSSAGAIAAVMLASPKAMDTFVEKLKSVGGFYLTQMKVSSARGMARVWRGKPYFPNIDLTKFFHELFITADSPKKVGEPEFEPQLYYTDLYSLESTAASKDETIANALA